MTNDPSMSLGVSQCLLGDAVRYDGGHKRNDYIIDALSTFFRLVPACPEVTAGFGIPREPVRLEGHPSLPRVISVHTRRDLTTPLQESARQLVAQFADARLSGFILKHNSPSCGLERVRIWNETEMPAEEGAGLFAHALCLAFPWLPVTEEAGVNDPVLREHFLERIFVWQRLRALLSVPSAEALVTFHARHKFQIMAHSPVHMRQLGRLVAQWPAAGSLPLKAYADGLTEAMQQPASVKKHVDVLLHLAGFLKQQLNTNDKNEWLELLSAYRAGKVPLIVPVTRLNHHACQAGVTLLTQQFYLQPDPVEVCLRHHV